MIRDVCFASYLMLLRKDGRIARRRRWLKELPGLGQLKEQAYPFVQTALLNLPTVFPTRQSGFRYTQALGQFFLRQTEFLAVLADFLRRQQTGLAAECLNDLLVGLRIEDDFAAISLSCAPGSKR
jgi:hypothetical protein